MSSKPKYQIESFSKLHNGQSFFSHENTFIKYNNDSARALTDSKDALCFKTDPLYAAVFVMDNIASDDENMRRLLMSNRGVESEEAQRIFINTLVEPKDAFILNTAYAMHLISNTSDLYLNQSEINEDNAQQFFDENLKVLSDKIPGDFSIKLVKNFISRSASKAKEENDICDWAESVSLFACNVTERWVQEKLHPTAEDNLNY